MVSPFLLLDSKLLAATIGGTFAGGLHAVTGPDHLAALLPQCMGRRWFNAMCAASRACCPRACGASTPPRLLSPVARCTGAYWGLGHGIGAALVGALAFAVRGALNLDALSGYMEAAVGLSIIIIGLNGVRESREWATEHEEEEQAWAVPSREPSDSWSSSLKVSVWARARVMAAPSPLPLRRLHAAGRAVGGTQYSLCMGHAWHGYLARLLWLRPSPRCDARASDAFLDRGFDLPYILRFRHDVCHVDIHRARRRTLDSDE